LNRRQKIALSIIALAMFGLLLVVLLGDNGMIELRRLGRTHQALVEENRDLTRQNLKMYRSIDRLQSDPAFVENIARRELGMIRSNELIFKFKSGLASH
jgi:cell division protein FtsB